MYMCSYWLNDMQYMNVCAERRNGKLQETEQRYIALQWSDLYRVKL